MKYVTESLSQFYDYKFFKLIETKEDQAELKEREKDGLAVIDKINKNFDKFEQDAKGEILKYKEFWEENKQAKEAFSENGNIYKFFDGDYVVGVLELPAEKLSDGSIDGGMGAVEGPQEEIIEGKEITEAEEPKDDLGLDLGSPEEKPEEQNNLGDLGNLETPAQPGEENPENPEQPEKPEEKPVDLSSPQKYFVVYDMSGGEREEIFRCGSNNVVNSFNSFYNDTFKGAMKDIILKYQEQKATEKQEAEKSEKKKIETEKDKKLKKFLGKESTKESPKESKEKED